MITIADPRPPAPPTSSLDRALARLIKDPRDLPFVYVSFSALLVLLPLALAMFLVDPLPWWLPVGYLAVLFLGFVDRYTLMLHCTSHRRLYANGYGAMNHIIPLVLAPLMGQTPYTYLAHHIGMHHPENNLGDDLSTTMRYRRDSLRGFLHYLGTFLSTGIFQLARYHFRRGHGRMARMALIGELGWFAAVIALGFVNLTATLVVLVVPFLLVRFLMMAGNWAQHAFIDPDDPSNPYRNSITSVNTRYNRRCFNDGYHIGHHVKANRHWTEMAVDFEKNIDRYRSEGAVVFEGIDYFQIWALLMAKRYTSLARRFVDLQPVRRSEADIVAFLRARTRPIRSAPVTEPAAPQTAQAAGA